MKRRILFVLLALFLSFGIQEGFAQDEDEQSEVRETKRYRNKNEVKTLSGGNGHSGGFGAISFRGTDYLGETMVLLGLRGGWIINRVVAIGFEGHGIIPTVTLTDIDPVPSNLTVLGGYGGLFLEGIIFSNEIVHLVIPISGGAGWMGYEEDFFNYAPGVGADRLVSDDVFWYIEPGVALELNVARHFRMNFGVSKRFTQDFDLIDTPSDAFDKLNYFVTLKFGRF